MFWRSKHDFAVVIDTNKVYAHQELLQDLPVLGAGLEYRHVFGGFAIHSKGEGAQGPQDTERDEDDMLHHKWSNYIVECGVKFQLQHRAGPASGRPLACIQSRHIRTTKCKSIPIGQPLSTRETVGGINKPRYFGHFLHRQAALPSWPPNPR